MRINNQKVLFIKIKLKKDMKLFATLALIGSTSAMGLEQAINFIDKWDKNGDECLEWGEFKAAADHYYESRGRAVPTAKIRAIFNNNASP